MFCRAVCSEVKRRSTTGLSYYSSVFHNGVWRGPVKAGHELERDIVVLLFIYRNSTNWGQIPSFTAPPHHLLSFTFVAIQIDGLQNTNSLLQFILWRTETTDVRKMGLTLKNKTVLSVHSTV